MFLFQLFQVLSWSFQRNLIFNFDEAFRRPGHNDQGPRAEAACAVCARKFWKHDLKQLVLFSDPDDEDLTTPNDTVAKGSQARMCDLLGVERYGERWKHIVSTDAGKAELISSAVSHPFLPEKKTVAAQSCLGWQPHHSSGSLCFLQAGTDGDAFVDATLFARQ